MELPGQLDNPAVHPAFNWHLLARAYQWCRRVERLVAGEHPHARIVHPQWLAITAQCGVIKQAAADAHGVLVDVGCGQKPFASMFRDHVSAYIGIDDPTTAEPLGGSKADVLGTVEQLPLRSASVDTVLVTEVLEHLPEPALALAELHRLLKPGGLLIVTTPMIYNRHGSPRDFFRFTPEGLCYLLERSGFSVTALRPQGSFGTAVGLLTNNFLTVAFERHPLLRVLRYTLLLPLMPLVFAWVNAVGWMLDGLVREPDFSFNHLALARKT